MEAWVLDESGKGLVERQLKTVTVNLERVRQSLEELRDLLPEDRPPADGTVHRWRMDEVELVLELSGEGGVKLLGSATVGVTGGIHVKFKRTGQ